MSVKVTAMVTGIIITIIAFIVGFNLVGGTASTLTTASNNISGSGLPLASLFGSSGVLLIIFMSFLFLGFMGIAFGMAKKH